MSTSGIGPSAELTAAFSDAIDSKSTVRFIKVVISNESLVPTTTIPRSGTFKEDLDKLDSALEDNTPAYILARTDKGDSDWVLIYYVPETSKARDKMLYASTKSSLTKSLGEAHFTDTISATSKDDVNGKAYARHLQHLAAPKPLSQREKALAQMDEAEKEAANEYQGSNARRSHLNSGVIRVSWSPGVENAFKQLAVGESSKLLVLTVKSEGETLEVELVSFDEITADQVGPKLPPSEPVYAFFGWHHNLSVSVPREIVFIYSCPSASPVKHRMLYSSSLRAVYQAADVFLSSIDGASPLAKRKVETSDPKDITKTFLTNELGSSSTSSSSSSIPTRAGLVDNGSGTSAEAQLSVKELTQQFSRPRAPARNSKRP